MKKEETEREILTTISRQLDHVIGLLAVQQSEGGENTKIQLLYELGVAPAAIAAILGLTPNAVAIRMTRIRKKARSKAR